MIKLKVKKYDFNQWVKAAGVRAVKTIVSASCLSGVVSILTSVAGLPELEEIVDES